MKSKIYFITLRVCLAFTLLAASAAYTNAQNCNNPPSCIENPDMTGTLGNLNWGSTQTVNGWFVAQGSPNVQNGGAGGTNRIGMWSFNGSGEGIYSCFDFRQNRTYQICLWVQNTTAETRGNLEIMAANGLTQDFSTNPRPTPLSSELIDDNHIHSPNLTQLVINYTPTANFSQLWIFPDNAVPLADYRIKVSRVNIIELPLGIGISASCGEEIVLPASTQTCATTSWFDPEGNPIGTGTVVINNADPTMSGDYTMTVSVGDCESSTTIQVLVEECNCDEFEASFDVSGVDQPINFTETSGGPGTSVAWFWDFGDGNTSNSANPTHNFSQAGVYEVCLTVIRRVGNQTCCKRICQEIEVGEPSDEKPGEPHSEGKKSSSSATGFEYTPMEIPRAVEFSKSITSGAFTEYTWDFGDGAVSGRETPSHIYAKEGTYKVCLTVHNKVYDANGNFIEKSDKEYCNEVKVGAAMYNMSQAEVHVMPNPSRSKAYVTVDNIPNPQVVLRNMAGVEVATGKIANPNQYIVNLEGLPSGIYIVEVKSELGSKAIKLIKE